MGLISQGVNAAVVASGLLLALAWPVQSQSIEEAALRLSLMLSREVTCAGNDPVFSVAAVPAEDESQTLDAQVLARIEGVVLDALRRETLDCVRITEVTRAFDTLAFVQNLGRWETLGAEQRNLVASELADSDATATILLNRSGDTYTASLGLVELASGRLLASARAEIPETLTATGCGTAAAAEARGLETLAASLVTRLRGAQVLYVAPATYQDSFDPLGYGRYIADQFIAALSAQEGNVITGSRLTVRRLDVAGSVVLSPEDHEIALRYWPCEDLSAVRLNVVALSDQGDVVTLSQDLSLAALPTGLVVVPPVLDDVSRTSLLPSEEAIGIAPGGNDAPISEPCETASLLWQTLGASDSAVALQSFVDTYEASCPPLAALAQDRLHDAIFETTTEPQQLSAQQSPGTNLYVHPPSSVEEFHPSDWIGATITGRLVSSGSLWYSSLHSDGTTTYRSPSGNVRTGTYRIRGRSICYLYTGEATEACRTPVLDSGRVNWVNDSGNVSSYVVEVTPIETPQLASSIQASGSSVSELIGDGRCALIIAARPSVQAAHEYINENRFDINSVQGYLSVSGWIAISIGTLPLDGHERIVADFIARGQIPSDSYCSQGRTLEAAVNLR